MQKHRGILERLQAGHNWDRSRQGSFLQLFWSTPLLLSGHPVYRTKNFNPWRSNSFHLVLCGAGNFERHDISSGTLDL